MGKYFDRFPTVDYDGKLAKNILSKVDFTDKSKRDIYSRFDFTLSESSARPDILSEAAYNNPYYDWLIYLANQTIDPYYDYYLNDSNLMKHIKNKYGGVAEASKKILYYRNNWAPDNSTISVAIFDSLDSAIQKYYKPILSNANQVTGYVRRTDDWIISTNQIIDLTVPNASLAELNERIVQSSTNASATVIAIDTESNIIRVQHVDGVFEVDSDILEITLVQQVIPLLEASFWAPVNAYEMELEKNEANKHISLIKASYLPDLDKAFIEQIRK